MTTLYMLNMRTQTGEWMGYYRCDRLPEEREVLPNTIPSLQVVKIGAFDRQLGAPEDHREMWHVTVVRV